MNDVFRSALYAGQVMHQRTRPRAHRLRYRVFYMAINLNEADELARRLRLFSFNRFNLFSLHERDYGDGSGASLGEQARARLREAGLKGDGAVTLLTMPRVLGFAFNPLSLYFCHRRDGALAAIVYEVNNTFGQRHSYVAPAIADEDGVVRQEADKTLYVSPFLGTDLRYQFAVAPPGERVALSVTARDELGPLLFAKLSATRRPLSDVALLRALVSCPLLTLKVVLAIHWEALRLLLKGVRLVERPVPPTATMTVGRAAPRKETTKEPASDVAY